MSAPCLLEMPPASPQKPLLTSYGKLTEFADDPITCMRRLYTTHGNLAVLQEESQRIVFVFCPEYNQQILSDTKTFHAKFFTIRGPKNSAQRRLTCGLLGMNGEQHKRNRRIVKEPFGKRAIGTYYHKIAQIADEMLSGWKLGQESDLHAEMTRYMLRVTSSLLFGFDEQDMAIEIGRMIDQWGNINHDLGVGALVPDARFSSEYEGLLAYAEQLEERIMGMIRLRREQDRPGDDVLSILVRMHDEQGGLSDEELVGQSAVLFAAAHLTTAHSLTWTLFLLSQHPEMLSELQAELQSADLSEIARAEVRGENLTALDRIIKESMRVLPASSYSQRLNNIGTKLGPLDLPRGTPIVFSSFMTHHRPDIYRHPEQFDPDRWKTLRPSPYEYLPFGAGPRLCIGAPLAMMVLKTTLPRILLQFTPAVVPGARIDARAKSTMLSPTTPVPVQLLSPGARPEPSYVEGSIHDLVALPKR